MQPKIQQIIEYNQPFINEMIESYNILKDNFKAKNLQPVVELTFWASIKDVELKAQIVKLGFYVSGFIKHQKKQNTITILKALDLDADFCIAVSQAQILYSMQKAFEDETGKKLKTKFYELLEKYNENVLDVNTFKMLYVIIEEFEKLFKVQRLKVFSPYVLGLTYEDLKYVKDFCFKENYENHSKVAVNFELVENIYLK